MKARTKMRGRLVAVVALALTGALALAACSSAWEQGNTFPLRKKWVHLARIYRCNVSDIETARKERNNGKEEAKPGGPVAG